MVNKITVVGAGNVGATTAQRVAEKELARTVVMVDVVEGIPQGKGLDQWQTAPIEGFDTRVIGTNGYAEAAGSELFIVTAGIARKPGMSREDLLNTNVNIVKSVAQEIKKCAPDAFVIVVSDPLDVSVEDIQAMVLGGHGDTMVPLISYTTVAGIPVTQLLKREVLDKIVDRARNGGAEIVAFLKTGSAYYAPSAAAVQMAEAIALDKRRILPCSAWLQGEFGLRDVFCGVPCKLGRAGLEGIVEITLTSAEREELHKSAEAVRTTQAVVDAA